MNRLRIGVIAAAGKGTRAYPRTNFIPKPLFKIENKSILSRNIDLLYSKLKIEKIYIIIGHLKELIVEEVENLRYLYPKVSLETVDWTTRGLASDVANLETKIHEPFVLILGDEYYYKTNHEKFLDTYKKNKNLIASIAVLRTSVKSRIRKNYSVELDGKKIRNLVEKPENPPNELLGLGSYLFTTKYFEYFKKTPPSSKSGVVEITDVIDLMAKESKEVYATEVNCDYFNINSMQDYHYAVYEVRNDLFEKYKISLIIPTHNNEKSLSDVIVDFKDKVHEIIVVDAESTDETVELAKSFKVKLEYYFYDTKTEYEGVQIRQGFNRVTGDIVILVSPDGSFRSKDLPKLLEYLKDSDMVVGTRTTRQMIEQGSNLKPLPRFINLLMGKLIEAFWWNQEPRFTDVDCKYFAIWKDSYNRVKPQLEVQGSKYTVELMIEMIRAHMRCIEIPVSYFKPVEGAKYKWKDAFREAIDIFKIAFKKKREDFKEE